MRSLCILMLALAACGTAPRRTATTEPSAQSDPLSRPQAPLEKLDATMIYRLYEANEIKADSLLKGKRFIISGDVKSIGKDILGEPYVLLEASPVWGVQCMARGQDAALAELLPGQKVSLAGTINGKMANIIARDCQLIPALATGRR